jgi:hypothetical protein
MVAPKKKGARPRKPRATAATPTANPARGEHNVTLLGKRYVLRPSFTAQVAIEEKTGRSYAELAMDGQTGALKIGHLGIIVAEMINAGAEGPLQTVSEARIAEMIYEEGVPAVAAVATVAIIDALTGGRKATGEVKAAVATDGQ